MASTISIDINALFLQYDTVKKVYIDTLNRYSHLINVAKKDTTVAFDIMDPIKSLQNMIIQLKANHQNLIEFIKQIPVTVQTWNVNESKINPYMCSLILGTKKGRLNEKGIYLFQEYDLKPFKTPKFVPCLGEFRVENELVDHSVKLYYKDKVVMIGDETVGMSGPTRDAPHTPHYTSHGDIICWSDHFEFVRQDVPTYWKDSLTSGSKELGHRSTKWTIIRDKDTNTHYAILSIHGSQNQFKALHILRGILNDTQKYIKSKYHVIVGGDLNETPEVLFGNDLRGQPRYIFRGMKTVDSAKNIATGEQITHVNIDPKKPDFKRRLDYIFVDNGTNILSEKIVGMYRNSDISKAMKDKGHDHGIVQMQIL